jgi:ATP synthase protein I
MSSPPPPEDPFVKTVRREAERARKGRHLTFWQGLSTTGTIGWMVSLPLVLGALAGRWLDQQFHSGLFWTLSLLMLGLVIGCATAWRHVRRELNP